MARLILLLLLALLAAVAAAAPPPVVSLTAGRVSGACWATACAYRAVPYAAPPTRDNRWRPPQPAPPWRGVRDGSRPGRACVQTPLDESSPQSEDCLHADVYVPKAKAKAKAKKAKGLPVLVFFYGGGMLSGANAWYNLSSFVRGGDGDGGGEDFVVVAPNYRLGPLGWLALKELSAEKGAGGASGNYGLMDAQASLRWVAANIGAFGGDPARVTLMGQSSGATVLYGLLAHLQPKQAAKAPLFTAAILLSASPNVSMPLVAAEAQNAALVHSVGCDSADASKVLACLRNASAGAVSYGVAPVNTTWQQADILTWGWPTAQHAATGWQLPGLAIIDGNFIPASSGLRASLASADLGGVDLLIQNVECESDLMPQLDVGNYSAAELASLANTSFARWASSSNNFSGEALLATYAREMKEGGPQKVYDALSADLGTSCGQLRIVRELSALTDAGAPRSVRYAVTTAGPSQPQLLGISRFDGYLSRFSYHESDLIWAMAPAGTGYDWFATFSGVAPKIKYAPTADDEAQSALLRGLWQGFGRNASAAALATFGAGGVNLIGKRSTSADRQWRAGACGMLEAALGDELPRFFWAN